MLKAKKVYIEVKKKKNLRKVFFFLILKSYQALRVNTSNHHLHGFIEKGVISYKSTAMKLKMERWEENGS